MNDLLQKAVDAHGDLKHAMDSSWSRNLSESRASAFHAQTIAKMGLAIRTHSGLFSDRGADYGEPTFDGGIHAIAFRSTRNRD